MTATNALIPSDRITHLMMEEAGITKYSTWLNPKSKVLMIVINIIGDTETWLPLSLVILDVKTRTTAEVRPIDFHRWIKELKIVEIPPHTLNTITVSEKDFDLLST